MGLFRVGEAGDSKAETARVVRREAAEAGEAFVGRPGKWLSTADLFGDDTEIGIVHSGIHYRLRLTRQGKLVLNK